MQQLLYLLIIGLLFFTSCQEEEPPIDQDKMAEILTELHMAESVAQLMPIDKGGYMTKNYDTMYVLYSNIYAKNNLDTTTFKAALDWYEQRPKIFDKVYDQVLEKLSIRKEAIKDSIVEYSDSVSIRKPDSL